MERHIDNDGLIDLGDATIETKGPPAGAGDVIGQQRLAGITDE
ncbi:hypothetical protein EBBID32_40290 [Sphingobium indicum BiD32]|uniref:Benenodin family lasso peptide n=1 Tax=Sphingobium indicum BiD32 TaxID=1301087 RepID=N1MR31_9SPHN|nr:benenodin family lasso peptide [Sphingobium indicum]CCW19660.1 hypothetical protein EBBID32_40290 [Sphingobium indicum BiD32]